MNRYILLTDGGEIVGRNMNRDFLVSEAKEWARKNPGRKYYIAAVELELEAPPDGVTMRRPW